MNRTVRRCRIAGRRSVLTRSARRAAVASSSTGGCRRRAAYSMLGHDDSERSTSPAGDLVLMPMPLSSQTYRIGSGAP